MSGHEPWCVEDGQECPDGVHSDGSSGCRGPAIVLPGVAGGEVCAWRASHPGAPDTLRVAGRADLDAAGASRLEAMAASVAGDALVSPRDAVAAVRSLAAAHGIHVPPDGGGTWSAAELADLRRAVAVLETHAIGA